MNKFKMSSAAVALLMVPVAACGSGKSTESASATRAADATEATDPAYSSTDDPGVTTTTPASDTMTGDASMTTKTAAGDTMTGDAADTMPMDAGAGSTAGLSGVVYLGATEISGKDFIGEEIYNDAGQKVATVDDVLIGTNGQADRLVFTSDGEFFGLGDRKGSVPFSAVSVGFTEPQEPMVRLSITEQQAQGATEFKQDGLNDYRLLSEIIGAEVDIAGSDDDEARIENVIMTKEGMAKSVVVQRSAIGVGAGDKYAFDYSTLSVEQGDGGLTLNVSETEMDSWSKFDESRPRSDNMLNKPN